MNDANGYASPAYALEIVFIVKYATGSICPRSYNGPK